MDFQTFWRKTKNQLIHIKSFNLGDCPRFIEQFLNVTLYVMAPIRIENDRRKFSKLFVNFTLISRKIYFQSVLIRYVVTLLALITFLPVIAAHMVEKFSDLNFVTLMTNTGLFRKF